LDNPVKEYRDPADGRLGHKWHKKVKNTLAFVGFDAFSNETVAIRHHNYKIGTRWLHEFVNYTEEVMYRYPLS